MTGKELVKRLEQDGWTVARINGSHHIMKHPSKPGSPSVPVHANRDLPKGLAHGILKEARLK